MKKYIVTLVFLLLCLPTFASYILIPMDAESQKEHLKAYGITYWSLEKSQNVKWLLNYRGGSFLLPDTEEIRRECQIRGVSFEILSDNKAEQILLEISSPSKNMDAILLEKAPRIAVYSPKTNVPWDDAVTMVLTYAEIPYDVLYDEEVLADNLLLYDWLHLHHEDFTGQYGKFYRVYRNAPWYIEQKKEAEALATKLGFNKVSDAKLAVALKIRDYVVGGGFMFAMCSATDSFDIALAAEDVDICEPMFDGDASDAGYQNKIDFEKTFAFTDFILERDPMVYEFSSIDMTTKRNIPRDNDYFSLMDYSAKWDPIPTMLVQNHTSLVKGFMGQSTSFDPKEIKTNVLVMGKNKLNNEARYIHGIKGKGFFTFYGGHDPEDYEHRVGDAPTELALHPNSPGYRLILNNVLFPAAEKKKQKT
ncbi:MAG: asparagine synthetase B [Flavobacteriaceae bacterium CG18_big_fil_WC_8_21_14_2_50_34_36]|nr:MAG: asparagine synthetase B [Flavobacteriaceae bacterium CG18_big_fil_WC_8_21_14_2_50_34_36]PIV49095.1 MAG: asparagine synthetase B [Flavobacteriaceae bacterium CG02_land_8_20_14_3_00_34_13]PIZ08463.1 MAG: asparagine synthetase B [Flavobacteriaceae bacterium CG_4_10_14_0_8_um_filter_34_31]PJC07480.1 MAG: asparagine synthetase B [Flavobacteriaceae bacterium CG_4_9_14_0_8_um_filter_34_30]